jgi:hypothetical protein
MTMMPAIPIQSALRKGALRIPRQSCARGSQFDTQIGAVRAAIDAQFGGIITARQEPNIPVTVTGVTCFDPPHGQEGKAPNGIELHPLLDIQFQ